jgi:hypothetical protein
MRGTDNVNTRRQPGNRLSKLSDAGKSRTALRDVNATYGPAELCTWRFAPGISRFQTTDPQFGRKLEKRSKARLVGWSVTNGYLRIFQEEIEPWRARLLVKRYLATANEAFSTRAASLLSTVRPSAVVCHSNR